ncbi:alpha/beta fold hydrolase [Streptomyces sp. NPDC004778]
MEAVAKKCAASHTAGLLPHITTANTARDLGRVREALGEPKASYFGISYGSYLGSVWATMFPKSTDRVFLDSLTGPGGWNGSFARTFRRGFEDRFPDFAEFAAAQNEKYGLVVHGGGRRDLLRHRREARHEAERGRTHGRGVPSDDLRPLLLRQQAA